MIPAPPRKESAVSQASDSIWRDDAFLRLWSASSISYVGNYITRAALPLTAILILGSGALEISALRSLEWVGLLLVGLVAGAWVDRLRRRPIMITADVARALLLGSIPVAALAGVLSLTQLLVVAFLAAVLSTFFDAASVAYLPTIIARKRLVAANSALTGSAATAEFVGFSLSGVLVQVLSAPIAIAVDAASFVASALLLRSIRGTEAPQPPIAGRQSVLLDIREGMRVLAGQPLLRALAAAHAAMFVFWGIFGALYIVFAVREVGLPPALVGVIAALGGVGSLAGAAVAGRIGRRIGVGPTMVLGLTGMTLGAILIPLAPSDAVFLGAIFLVGEQLITDSCVTVFDVMNRSVTQSIVEDRLLGRVQATIDFVTTVVALSASIAGGIIAEVLGLRVAMAVAVAGGILAVAILWFSPVRSIRGMPEPDNMDNVPATEEGGF